MLAECTFSFQRGFVSRVSVGEKIEVDEKTFKKLSRAGFVKAFSGTVPYSEAAAVRASESSALPAFDQAVVMPPIRRGRKKKVAVI
jgi:hypothetical protein